MRLEGFGSNFSQCAQMINVGKVCDLKEPIKTKQVLRFHMLFIHIVNCPLQEDKEFLTLVSYVSPKSLLTW